MAVVDGRERLRIVAAGLFLCVLASCNPAVSAAEDAVKRTLRDPDSAQFQRVEPCERAGVNGFRGEVNAKNALGGYVGFSPFIVIDGQAIILSRLEEQGGGIQVYPSDMHRWDALFRQCSTDQVNQAVDNAARASDAAANAAVSEAENQARAAEAAANAAVASIEREADRARERAEPAPSDDPMRNAAPDD